MSKKASQDSNGVTLTLEYERPKTIWRIVGIIAGTLFLSLLIAGLLLYRRANRYLETFLAAAQVDRAHLETIFAEANQDWQNYAEDPNSTINHKNFLILGGDQLAGRHGDPILTDTILLLQLNLKNNQIKIISLPRDLYHEAYQTKINALYYYGLERNPDNPLLFPTQVISELTGINIDHSILINIEDLETLIDLLSGVEVEVPIAFTDPLFPRQDVDVSQETDPAVLYETISFEQGKETMSGLRALQYMRSRHSGDDEGTDLARANRQQLVLQALVKKVASPQFLLEKPTVLGQLYRFYLDHFASSLSVNEVLRVLMSWLSWSENNQGSATEFSFANLNMTVYPEDENGLLINPPLWQTQQQWRYDLRDQVVFKDTLSEFFKIYD